LGFAVRGSLDVPGLKGRVHVDVGAIPPVNTKRTARMRFAEVAFGEPSRN